MQKYFLFKTDKKIKENDFIELFESFGVSKKKIIFLDEKEGYVIEDKSFYSKLQSNIAMFNIELGLNIFFLFTHALNKSSLYALHKLFPNFKNQAISLYQASLYLIVRRDQQIITLIQDEFNDIDQELVITIYNYINNDLNAIITSLNLFIHRNTFIYRLNKFIDITSCDVRDYFNASYFLLYYNLKYLIF